MEAEGKQTELSGSAPSTSTGCTARSKPNLVPRGPLPQFRLRLRLLRYGSGRKHVHRWLRHRSANVWSRARCVIRWLAPGTRRTGQTVTRRREEERNETESRMSKSRHRRSSSLDAFVRRVALSALLSSVHTRGRRSHVASHLGGRTSLGRPFDIDVVRRVPRRVEEHVSRLAYLRQIHPNSLVLV